MPDGRQWRIYYDDGSTCDSLSSSAVTPEDAPGLGVVVIVQEDEDVGRELLHMKDFYYWERSRWFGCDQFGLFDYLQRPGLKKVVAGRNVEHRSYHLLMLRAQQDPDFPPKNARLTGELPPR
jgi:hypothetical protein